MAVAWRRTAAMLSCLCLIGATLLTGAPLAHAEDTVAFTIEDERITESSALARDTASNAYWTANDSGDRGEVYALDEDGKVTGSLNYHGSVLDVEALAMHNNTLYVGDIGDNGAERQFVTVYFFDDPAPTDDGQSVQYRAYDFAYPDGAKDAETMYVDGAGRIFIVSKGEDGGIYAAPEQPSREQVNQLERVSDAPPYVTDGVYLADQNLIALRTYVSIEMVDPNDDYKVVGRSGVPLQPQGESVTQSLDGTSLLVGSEGKASKVYSVPIPAKIDKAPEGESKPPPTSSPSPKPSKSVSAEASEAAVADSEGSSRRGTLMALGLAALVAIIAGVVVFRSPGRRQ